MTVFEISPFQIKYLEKQRECTMTKKSGIGSIAVIFTVLAIIPLQTSAMTEGFILAGSYSGTKTYLFDKDGVVVHTWDHTDTISHPLVRDYLNGYSCYLLENGNLLRSGQTDATVSQGAAPKQGTLSEINFDGTVVWGWYDHANSKQMMHHDFKPMPNGHVLCVSFVNTSRDVAQAAGMDSLVFEEGTGPGNRAGTGTSIELEKIFEVIPDKTGAGNHQIVWEWNIIDHIVPKAEALQHPELFSGDLRTRWYGQWVHLNGIDYDPVNDLIVFSSRLFSEFFVIDHSTTTQEAAGHTGGTHGKGGDLLYRWGRPSNWCVAVETPETSMVVNRIGTRRDTTYKIVIKKSHENNIVNCLHCPNWIPQGYAGAGDVLFFHNNVDASMARLNLSEAMEVKLPATLQMAPNTPTTPLLPTWKYHPVDTMFSASMSSALRMKCGNTLIHEAYPGGNNSGNGSKVREVDAAGTVVWGPIELKPPAVSGGTIGGMFMSTFSPPKIMYYPEDYPGIKALFDKINGVANRVERYGYSGARRPGIRYNHTGINVTNAAGSTVRICTIQGRLIAVITPSTAQFCYPVTGLATGTYIVTVKVAGRDAVRSAVSVMR
jgi:hypothetical protein